MDKTELQKNIALYYSKLPPEAQAVFAKMEWLEKIKQISEKYALSQAQQETLGTETTLVLLGIIHPQEYEETLKREISIAPVLVKEIIAEIKGSVLDSITPQLTDTFEKNTEGEEVEKIDGELDERFKRLPKSIQDAIGESNYQNALYEISKKYKFTIEQMGLLEESLVKIMLNQISENVFRGNIQNDLRLADWETNELITMINNKILAGIKGKIMSQPAAPQKEIKQEEMQILHDSGIKIIPTESAPTSTNPQRKPDLSVPELTTSKPSTPSPMAQKFSSPVQTSTVKTEHTTEQPKNVAPEPPKSYPKGVDPYREMPE